MTKSLDCKYYDLTKFNETKYITVGLITIIHINLQSIFKDYNLFKGHSDSLNIEFNVIAITKVGINNLECWIHENIFKACKFYYHGPVNSKRWSCIYERGLICQQKTILSACG